MSGNVYVMVFQGQKVAWKSWLSFHHVDPGNRTQVFRCCSKCLYSLAIWSTPFTTPLFLVQVLHLRAPLVTPLLPCLFWGGGYFLRTVSAKSRQCKVGPSLLKVGACSLHQRRVFLVWVMLSPHSYEDPCSDTQNPCEKPWVLLAIPVMVRWVTEATGSLVLTSQPTWPARQ